MNITRDLIATVTGPGWSYGLARVLIDDSTNMAAVFVPPGSAPVQTFSVTQATVQGGTGTVTLADGSIGKVVFRRRGAGCSFALAKCQVSTLILSQRWQSAQVSS